MGKWYSKGKVNEPRKVSKNEPKNNTKKEVKKSADSEPEIPKLEAIPAK